MLSRRCCRKVIGILMRLFFVRRERSSRLRREQSSPSGGRPPWMFRSRYQATSSTSAPRPPLPAEKGLGEPCRSDLDPARAGGDGGVSSKALAQRPGVASSVAPEPGESLSLNPVPAPVPLPEMARQRPDPCASGTGTGTGENVVDGQMLVGWGRPGRNSSLKLRYE